MQHDLVWPYIDLCTHFRLEILWQYENQISNLSVGIWIASIPLAVDGSTYSSNIVYCNNDKLNRARPWQHIRFTRQSVQYCILLYAECIIDICLHFANRINCRIRNLAFERFNFKYKYKYEMKIVFNKMWNSMKSL